MVDLFGLAVSAIATCISVAVNTVLFDAFFLRKKHGVAYARILVLWMVVSILFSSFLSKYGYAITFAQEILILFIFCSVIYESRWDRRLMVVVTAYAVLYSYSYWTDALIPILLNVTYEEYLWNIPLYSFVFFVRLSFALLLALIIKKYHHPFLADGEARTWVSLSAVFPVSTLVILWQVHTHPEAQQTWQLSLLILNVVDIVALLLLDSLEEAAANREKLLAASERARVQDENIAALSNAYSVQRKMTHDFRAQLSTLSMLLDNEDLDAARNYLSDLKSRQSDRVLMVNTHNASIDAVLNQKGYAAQATGIDMRFRVNDLSAIKLPPIDVTIVLANLLDNAIEACASFEGPERWVSVQVLYDHGILSVRVINPSKPVKIIDGHIPTSKSDPLLHGFGLSNVKDILDKYKAEYSFAYGNGRFIFTIDWSDT